MRRKSRKSRRRRRGCRNLLLVLFLAVVTTGAVWQILSIPKDYEVQELEEMGYPESLAKLYVRNKEARDFVLAYDETKGVSEYIDITNEVTEGEVPLFLQWDERWGYGTYGGDFMAVEGCGPTALSMVYCGLTGDSAMNPWEVAKLAENWGYYVSGQGSSWAMMDELAEMMGLTVRQVSFTREGILYELLAGNPIICIVGPGDFTTEGHFIVLTDVDDQGMVTVHDPNSREKSEKKWDIETIMDQTQNLWGYRF